MSDNADTNDTTTPVTPSEDVTGLKNKIRELMSKLKDAEAAAEEAGNANLDDLTKANKRIEKLEKDLKDANERATLSDSNLRSYRTDNEIAKLLVQHKVQNEDHEIVSSYIRAMTKWDDDGNPIAQDKPLTDFAKDYFSGAGKRYTQLPDNSGGGSTGNNGTTPPRMTAENWNWTEFAKIQIENPAEADALAKAAGKTVSNGS